VNGSALVFELGDVVVGRAARSVAHPVAHPVAGASEDSVTGVAGVALCGELSVARRSPDTRVVTAVVGTGAPTA